MELFKNALQTEGILKTKVFENYKGTIIPARDFLKHKSETAADCCLFKFFMCSVDRALRPGHVVADTLLPMMFLGRRKLGNICYGHKMFLNKTRNIFCVPDTVSATNVARAGKRGNICVRNNVSSFARAFKLIVVEQKTAKK